MCSVFSRLVKGSEDAEAFVRDIALHAGFVRANLEKDIGGNHLIKNIKALVGTGVFLSDRSLVDTGLRLLRAELPIQVLPDGGHFERSPSYHSQVLGDLLDVERLLLLKGAHVPGPLEESIGRMRAWLGAILMPDGDVPLLNDATLVGRTYLQALEPGPTPIDQLTVLKPSGYLVAHLGSRLHVVMDVGPPCPDTLPGHAHADCLSFELAIDGDRIIVDSGTSTYAPGARRQYERSTRAHNTVDVDGADQTEVWSVFRAARRARPQLEAALQTSDGIVVTGSHDGYTRLQGSPRHRRTWRISDDGVTIEDQVIGAGIHTSTNRLFLAPGTRTFLDRGSVRAGPLVVRMEGADLKLETCEVATGFGRLQPTSCLVAGLRGELPHHFRWTILIAT